LARISPANADGSVSSRSSTVSTTASTNKGTPSGSASAAPSRDPTHSSTPRPMSEAHYQRPAPGHAWARTDEAGTSAKALHSW